MSTEEENVQQIASEILRYLSIRPNAADNLEGIASWWLMRQRINEKLLLVERALDKLIAEGAVASRSDEVLGTLYYLSKE